MATHGVLRAGDRPAEELARQRIVLTNTLPLPPEKQIDKIEVLSIAPLIAAALNAVFDDTSVSEIFGGENRLAMTAHSRVWSRHSRTCARLRP